MVYLFIMSTKDILTLNFDSRSNKDSLWSKWDVVWLKWESKKNCQKIQDILKILPDTSRSDDYKIRSLNYIWTGKV